MSTPPPDDSPSPVVPGGDPWTSASASAERPAPHEGDAAAADRTPQDESARELLETVRSISRLEESN